MLGLAALALAPTGAHAFTFVYSTTSFLRDDLGSVPASMGNRMGQLYLAAESGSVTLADGESVIRRVHQAEWLVEGKAHTDYYFIRNFPNLVNPGEVTLTAGQDTSVVQSVRQSGRTVLRSELSTVQLYASEETVFDFGAEGTVVFQALAGSLTTDTTIEGEMFGRFTYFVSPVPEPFTMALGTAALAAVALRRRARA